MMIGYRCPNPNCSEHDVDKGSPAGALTQPVTCGACGTGCAQIDMPDEVSDGG